ncbi:MAG TPA: YciI family protein [Longimicrobium sp.]
MRFMIIRKADADTEAETMPDEKVFADMGAYNEAMINAGVMLSGDGLHPSSKGARIRFQNGKPTITDGPFAEAKELIAGFTIIQVASREEALEWVKRWPASDGNGNVELELRQIYEAEDFGEAFTPELREQEDRLRERLAEQR